MHGFRDNEVFLLTGYDGMVIPPPRGALKRLFMTDSERANDFLIVFHSNFFSVMNGFRDNEVLFQAGYDVIVISPLGESFDILFWLVIALCDQF